MIWALNGLEITEDRKQQIAFSIPYYATTLQISVRVENTAINSLADLKGKKVGTLKYSLAQRVLEREGGIKILTYDGLINSYQDLGNGRLDAVLNDYPIAIYYSKPNPKLKFTGPPVEQVLYGIGLRKEETALLKQLNDALLKLMKSGELRRIYEKWGLWNNETEKLFAELTAPQAQALEDFHQERDAQANLARPAAAICELSADPAPSGRADDADDFDFGDGAGCRVRADFGSDEFIRARA